MKSPLSPKKLFFFISYILFCAFASPIHADEITDASTPIQVNAPQEPPALWSQGFKPTAPQDWQKHPDKDTYYTETWSTIVYADAGHILYLNFLLTNIGVFSGNSALNISLTQAGQKAQSYKYTYDFDDLNVRGSTLSLKNSQWVLNGKDATLKIREADCQADLSFKGWTDGFKLDDAQYHNGQYWFNRKERHYTKIFWHVPRADVTGTITVKGKTLNMAGAGFIDHCAQNTLSSDYTDQWWNARLFNQDHTLLATTWHFFKKRGGHKLTRLILLDRTGIRFISSHAQFKSSKNVKDPDGYAYPTVFHWSDAKDGLEVHFASQRMHERAALLEEITWAIRKLATFVAGNPIVYRMEARGEVTLNATESHPAFSFSGRSLIESLHFNEDD